MQSAEMVFAPPLASVADGIQAGLGPRHGDIEQIGLAGCPSTRVSALLSGRCAQHEKDNVRFLALEGVDGAVVLGLTQPLTARSGDIAEGGDDVDQYKNCAQVLVTRRRLKSLLQFAEELRQLLRSAYGRDIAYNQNDAMFRLPNGATIQLTHVESSSALSDVAQGMSYTMIACDEAGEGPSMEVIDQLGVRVSPAKKGARVPRFEYLKQLMVNGEFFVASCCRMWLTTVPGLPRDPRIPDDCDSSANDHFLDATSYGVAGPQVGRVAMSDFTKAPGKSPTEDRTIIV